MYYYFEARLMIILVQYYSYNLISYAVSLSLSILF